MSYLRVNPGLVSRDLVIPEHVTWHKMWWMDTWRELTITQCHIYQCTWRVRHAPTSQHYPNPLVDSCSSMHWWGLALWVWLVVAGARPHTLEIWFHNTACRCAAPSISLPASSCLWFTSASTRALSQPATTMYHAPSSSTPPPQESPLHCWALWALFPCWK